MHHPGFKYCELRLDRSPVVVSSRWSQWSHELLVIRLSVNKPKLFLNYPHSVFQAFIDAMKNQGEIINPDIIDDIPF